MRKRTKYTIGASLFALSLLTGILGCVRRTGMLFCDTKVSLSGPVMLLKEASVWGEEVHHGAFSTAIVFFDFETSFVVLGHTPHSI